MAIKLVHLKKKPPGGEYQLAPKYGKIAAGVDAIEGPDWEPVPNMLKVNYQGTTTGKMTSSSPNLSNVPKGQTATGWHEKLVKLIAEGTQPHKPAKCKHCGKKALEWVRDEQNKKWYLVSVLGGKLRIHKCGEPTETDDYDSVMDQWLKKPAPSSSSWESLQEIADALKNPDASTILLDSMAQLDHYAKSDTEWVL